jgi:hypothetical protein
MAISMRFDAKGRNFILKPLRDEAQSRAGV